MPHKLSGLHFCRAVEEVWVPAISPPPLMDSTTFQGCLTAAPTLGRKGVWPDVRWPQLPGPSLFPSDLVVIAPSRSRPRHSPFSAPPLIWLGPQLTLVSLATECSGCSPPRGGRRNTLGFSRVLHAHRLTCRGLECVLLFRFMLNELCKAVSGLCPKNSTQPRLLAARVSWTEK